MEISYITDQATDEIYKINKTTLLIRRDTWELWKGNNKKGWNKKEEVLRKDYKEYIKAANRERVKELIEVEDINYFTTLEEAKRIEKKIIEEVQKTNLQEEKEQEQREGLKKQLREVIKAFEGVEANTLPIEEVKQYRAYIDTILRNLKEEIKDTKTTKELKKRERIEEYKASIKEYIEGGSFTSINKLCKDLKINRKTLYNLKLNEYIENL